MSESANFFYVNQEEYSTDMLALLKSFYPEQQLQVVLPGSKDKIKQQMEAAGVFASLIFEKDKVTLTVEGDAYVFLPEENPYSDFKEGLGAFLYRTLSGRTGKKLPWGTLIGVRPTKLAYHRIDAGVSDEDILDFYDKNRFVSEEKARLSLEIAHREHDIMEKLHLQNGYSLYIGIPFCPSTCLYCSFTSFPIGAYRKQTEGYVDSLIKELDATAELMQGKVLDTVYMGGGTPTTLEPGQLRRLISHVKEIFDFTHVQEFTVEAGRADSITEEKLLVLKELGVSRISVNPQTFNQKTLDFIGRKATAEETLEAFRLARKVGFDNINMDTILGLPGEGEEEVRYTMDVIRELAPESLTVHSLAIKRASKLAGWIEQNGIEMLNNTDSTMKIAEEAARSLGLSPYYLYRQKNMSGNFENVGYAAPGKNGIYNILIMEEVQTIVACGAGTVTKRVYPDGRIERCDNVKDVGLYISKIEEMIDRKRQLFSTIEC